MGVHETLGVSQKKSHFGAFVSEAGFLVHANFHFQMFRRFGKYLALGFFFSNLFNFGYGSVVQNERLVETIQKQIAQIQSDLLENKNLRRASMSQIRKMRKLLELQRKEIELSQRRVELLNGSLKELNTRRADVERQVEQQKRFARESLLDLYKLVRADHFGDSFSFFEVLQSDLFFQKSFFLKRTIQGGVATILKLKNDVQEAMTLGEKILEEKNKLDFYVLDLKEKTSELDASRMLQEEVLKSNKANHIETLRRFQTLRESEREMEKMLRRLRENEPSDHGIATNSSSIDEVPFFRLKGKIPLPTKGVVVNEFGRSFDRRNNLLTFQKGISIDAREKEGVVAVASGKVAFRGDLKNYGSVVILQHAGAYYSLYGHLGDVRVHEGDVVRSGEFIASTTALPLYFEIREKNIAVNPRNWLMIPQQIARTKIEGNNHAYQ